MSETEKMPEETKPDPKPGNSHRVILALSIGLCLLIATMTGAYYFVVLRPLQSATRLGKNVAQKLADLMSVEPRLTVNNRIIVNETKAIKELATAQKDFHVETEITDVRLKSQKRIKIDGEFRAKAGFDLQEPFAVEVSGDPPRIVVIIPQPHVLSVERRSPIHFDEQNGYWNKITPEERETALNALETLAKREARRSSIQADARKAVEEAVREIARSRQAEVEFRYGTDAPLAPKMGD